MLKESIDLDNSFVLVNGDSKLASTIRLTAKSLLQDLCSTKEQKGPLKITVVSPSSTGWVIVMALSSDQINCMLAAIAVDSAKMTS